MGALRAQSGASLNEFQENAISASAAGIEFGPRWVDNSFIENTLTANTCALKGSTAGNLFRANVFALNAADVCQ